MAHLPWNRRRATEPAEPAPPAAPPEPVGRELAARVASGIRVVLLWRPAHDDVIVSVDDTRTGERFELPVARERALHAFHHPFVYAA
jgi:hypothetical protein